jgi:hypothetical protein
MVKNVATSQNKNIDLKGKVMFRGARGRFLYGWFEDHHLGHFGYLSI